MIFFFVFFLFVWLLCVYILFLFAPLPHGESGAPFDLKKKKVSCIFN